MNSGEEVPKHAKGVELTVLLLSVYHAMHPEQE